MKDQIRAIIEEAENMRAAYFFAPPFGARARRKYEEQHSHERVEWREGGNTYTAAYSVVCSCKNIYAHGTYTKNGQKTTLTAIRNSYSRL